MLLEVPWFLTPTSILGQHRDRRLGGPRCLLIWCHPHACTVGVAHIARFYACTWFVVVILFNLCIQVPGTRRQLLDLQIGDARKKARVELDLSDGGMRCSHVVEHKHCIFIVEVGMHSIAVVRFCRMLSCVSLLCNWHILSAGAESVPGGPASI